MTKYLDTVVSYEDQIVDFVKKAKKPVVEYVAKGVELAGDRVPELTYPKDLPTPIEIVQTQATFAKKLIDANTALVTAVLETIAPVIGYETPKRAAKATKAAA